MFPSVDFALVAPELQLAAKILSHKSPGRLNQQRGLVKCHSGLSHNTFANGRVSTSPPEVLQRLSRREGLSKVATKAVAAGTFSYPFDDSQNGRFSRTGGQNGSMAHKSPKVEVFAKGKWRRIADSSLNDDNEPLPLPMTWPDSKPASKEEVDEMLQCDPEIKTCKDVIYQWTGDCKSCQGTGLVSFYRKKREVISKCVNCLGIGSVHKITSRASIQGMDDSEDESSNGIPGGGKSTNGRP